ncbi:MAG: MltA domain-containing protein [Alphaproteobacteria bacterium]
MPAFLRLQTIIAGAAAGLLAGLLVGCAVLTPDSDRLVLRAATVAGLPGWSDDDIAAAAPALAASCGRLMTLAANSVVGDGAAARPATAWQRACRTLPEGVAGDGAALRRWLTAHFDLYEASTGGGAADGLFTGYFEPELRGARTRGGAYQWPLYGRPPELVSVDLGLFRPALKGERIAGRVEGGRLVPFASRAEVRRGALAGRGLEIVWVDDPVDAFMLEVQGSGRVVLPDGAILRLGYDGQNGHAYVAIGAVLVRRGDLRREDVTLPAIRAWLAEHPDQALALLDENPSVVFFAERGEGGPLGSQGVALTAGRSLAVDRRFVPLGTPLWLAAEHPLAGDGAAEIRRLVVAQDTGGAIKGPVRGDLFWGAGEAAERAAGLMKSPGRYWLFLPKGD